jgi:hypothetical protein
LKSGDKLIVLLDNAHNSGFKKGQVVEYVYTYKDDSEIVRAQAKNKESRWLRIEHCLKCEDMTAFSKLMYNI